MPEPPEPSTRAPPPPPPRIAALWPASRRGRPAGEPLQRAPPPLFLSLLSLTSLALSLAAPAPWPWRPRARAAAQGPRRRPPPARIRRVPPPPRPDPPFPVTPAPSVHLTDGAVARVAADPVEDEDERSLALTSQLGWRAPRPNSLATGPARFLARGRAPLSLALPPVGPSSCGERPCFSFFSVLLGLAHV